MSHVASSIDRPAWIGTLPEDWTGDWLKWSVSLKTERATAEEQERLPYLSNENVESWTGRLLGDALEPVEADSRRFVAGDVLFNKLRPYLAKVFHAEFEGASSGELLCLRASNRVLPRYLFYVLTSRGFIDAVDAETFGSKMPRADWETVGHQPLPLPPHDTQRRIARFLDEKTARIDALIAKKRALLERLAEKRQALITQAVTKGLDPAVRLKDSGMGWLGKIPEHWEVKSLRYIATIGNGSTPQRDDPDYWEDGSYPWLNSAVVNLASVSEASDWVTACALKECHLPRIEPPAVLIGITGQGRTRGMASLLVFEATINQHLAYIKPFRAVADAAYIRHVMSVAYTFLRNESDGGGSTKGAITCEQLAHVRVPVPHHDEQLAIAAHVDAACTQFDRLVAGVRTSLDRLTEYRAALITAAVTGQLPALNG